MLRPGLGPRLLRSVLIAAATLVAFLALYIGIVRPWHMHWGAKAAEISRAIPGDTLVSDPVEVTTPE